MADCNCCAMFGQPHFHDCPAKINMDLLSDFFSDERLRNQEGNMPENITQVCAIEAIAIIQECRQMLKLEKGQKLTDAIRAITQIEGSSAVFNAMARFWKKAGEVEAQRSELDKAVERWVNAKRQQVLREDTKGDLQHEVSRQERDVEDAIVAELELRKTQAQR